MRIGRPQAFFSLLSILVWGSATMTSPAAAQGKPKPPSEETKRAPEEVPISDEAKRLFKLGVDFLKDPDGARYEDALRQFRLAYEASPSWKILGNLALAALHLERNGEAIDAYEKYLAGGGANVDAAERKQIERDLATLRAATGRLTLTSDRDATIIDSRGGGRQGTIYPLKAGTTVSLGLQAGFHTIEAKAGDASDRFDVSVEPGATTSRTLFEKRAAVDPASGPPAGKTGPSAPPSSDVSTSITPGPEGAPRGFTTLQTAGLATAGVGVVALAASVFTGLRAKSLLTSAETGCVDNRCPPANKGDADKAETMATTTNVLLVTGGVLGAAGATLFLVGRQKEPQKAAVHVQLQPGGLVVGGRY